MKNMGTRCSLSKERRDALLIVHLEIDRAVGKTEIDYLVEMGYVTKRHPAGWKSTSLGRDWIKTNIWQR